MKRLTLQHVFALPFVFTFLGFAGIGCGDEAPAKPPEPKYTLENVCSKIAAPTCAMRQSCCTQSHGYDEAGCMAAATAECEKNVADVKAGLMTFDGEFIDACIEATKPYSDSCFLAINDLFALPKDLEPCTHVFAGQLAAGATCERTEQCKTTLAEGELTRCDTTTKKCVTYTFLPLDSACTVNPKTTKICSEGLYCKAPILDGKCRPTTPPGAPCNNQALVSLECGWGYTCDSTTAVCVDAKNDGETCSLAVECKSATCTGGVCVKPEPFFTKLQCTNMP